MLRSTGIKGAGLTSAGPKGAEQYNDSGPLNRDSDHYSEMDYGNSINASKNPDCSKHFVTFTPYFTIQGQCFLFLSQITYNWHYPVLRVINGSQIGSWPKYDCFKVYGPRKQKSGGENVIRHRCIRGVNFCFFSPFDTNWTIYWGLTEENSFYRCVDCSIQQLAQLLRAPVYHVLSGLQTVYPITVVKITTEKTGLQPKR